MIARAIAAIAERRNFRSREHDLRYVWPKVKNLTPGNLAAAREAFAFYCSLSPAWKNVGEDKIAELVVTLT